MKQLHQAGLLSISLLFLHLPVSAAGAYTGTGTLTQGRADTTGTELLRYRAE